MDFQEKWKEAVARWDADELQRLLGTEGQKKTANEAAEELLQNVYPDGQAPSAKTALYIALTQVLDLKYQLKVENVRCRSLEKRITELEARLANGQTNTMSYRGIWREGDMYRSGELVTDKGTLWYCHLSTHERPGTSDSWRLMVKNR